ncbi:unnamed protein product, partial [Didymodactylos carnosus]
MIKLIRQLYFLTLDNIMVNVKLVNACIMDDRSNPLTEKGFLLLEDKNVSNLTALEKDVQHGGSIYFLLQPGENEETNGQILMVHDSDLYFETYNYADKLMGICFMNKNNKHNYLQKLQENMGRYLTDIKPFYDIQLCCDFILKNTDRKQIQYIYVYIDADNNDTDKDQQWSKSYTKLRGIFHNESTLNKKLKDDINHYYRQNINVEILSIGINALLNFEDNTATFKWYFLATHVLLETNDQYDHSKSEMLHILRTYY